MVSVFRRIVNDYSLLRYARTMYFVVAKENLPRYVDELRMW